MLPGHPSGRRVVTFSAQTAFPPISALARRGDCCGRTEAAGTAARGALCTPLGPQRRSGQGCSRPASRGHRGHGAQAAEPSAPPVGRRAGQASEGGIAYPKARSLRLPLRRRRRRSRIPPCRCHVGRAKPQDRSYGPQGKDLGRDAKAEAGAGPLSVCTCAESVRDGFQANAGA